MENTNKMNPVKYNADHQDDWQNAERNEGQWEAGANEGIDFRSAEAGGYGIDNHDTYYASRQEDDNEYSDDEEDDDTDDMSKEDDADDADDEDGDWGNVDPQSGGFPTGNEPTAPGSAV